MSGDPWAPDNPEFSPALRYLKDRGIDPELAADLGVTWDRTAIHYPHGRTRNLGDGPKMTQPPGAPLDVWWPWGRPTNPTRSVLVCEGESDALAALSAGCPMPVVSIPGTGFPVKRLARELTGVRLVYLAADADEAGDQLIEKAREAGLRVLPIKLDPGQDLADALADGTGLQPLLSEAERESLSSYGATSGSDFLLDQQNYEPIWGADDKILWASGEPLMICGDDGTGKTTIAQQVALARLFGDDVLGHPVETEPNQVLYIAADRPKQARRSLQRMVSADRFDELDRLTVLTKAPGIKDLTELAIAHGAGTVIVDTLGSVATNLGTDEGGMEVYHAIQEACAEGVEVLLLHHTRKRGEQLRGLDEVYGSRWLRAPCGSILVLSGHAGAEKIWLRHLKQPDQPVGGRVYHDHLRGRSYLEGEE